MLDFFKIKSKGGPQCPVSDSNKSRGLRTKAGKDSEVAALIDSDISRQAFRKNWARLIEKIYHVDPLICPKCQGKKRIIIWIEDEEVIEKILKHSGLWLPKRSPPPTRAHTPPQAVRIDYLDSQIPCADDYLIDPDYPTDSWTNKKNLFGSDRTCAPQDADKSRQFAMVRAKSKVDY
jgi:hypothetical protein